MVEDGKVYVFYLKLNPSKVLDVCGGGKENGTNIQIYDYNRVPQQRFQAIKSGNYFMFKDLNSGKMIDVENGEAKNGTNIQLYQKNDTDSQKWKIIKTNDGYYSFQSKINSNYYIDIKYGDSSNGNNVWLYEGNETDSQKFKIQEKIIYNFRVGVQGVNKNKKLEEMSITHVCFLIGEDLFEYGTQPAAKLACYDKYLNTPFYIGDKQLDKIIKIIEETNPGLKGVVTNGYIRRKGKDKDFNWTKLGDALSGKTWTQPDELEEIIKKSGDWTNGKYDAFFHNCHDFVRFCLLVVGANAGQVFKTLPVYRPSEKRGKCNIF